MEVVSHVWESYDCDISNTLTNGFEEGVLNEYGKAKTASARASGPPSQRASDEGIKAATHYASSQQRLADLFFMSMNPRGYVCRVEEKQRFYNKVKSWIEKRDGERRTAFVEGAIAAGVMLKALSEVEGENGEARYRIGRATPEEDAKSGVDYWVYDKNSRKTVGVDVKFTTRETLGERVLDASKFTHGGLDLIDIDRQKAATEQVEGSMLDQRRKIGGGIIPVYRENQEGEEAGEKQYEEHVLMVLLHSDFPEGVLYDKSLRCDPGYHYHNAAAVLAQKFGEYMDGQKV